MLNSSLEEKGGPLKDEKTKLVQTAVQKTPVLDKKKKARGKTANGTATTGFDQSSTQTFPTHLNVCDLRKSDQKIKLRSVIAVLLSLSFRKKCI